MFSKDFLTAFARKYGLSPEQEEVFLLWIHNGRNDQEISEELHVTVEAIRNRKTGIYKKFSIAGQGANKAQKLRNWLETKVKEQDIKADVPNDSVDLEILVQEVRRKIGADVTERCGTMRVLDMTQPVDLERIYTDVNILKDVIGRRRIGYDEVMEVSSREHFDRFLVGTIQERVTGLEAVEEFQKLVVLGKPGAGKTTFMKYLAMSCLGGKFHGELVPIFVTLKVYAETKDAPTLQEYIFAEMQQRKVSRDAIERLLESGRALILLDGLDEVKQEDDRRVKHDIDKFSRDWLKNRFAITCRIAAREYQFEKFTEVEVADFDDGQIETFINNWFREKDEEKAVRMWEKLRGNKPVKELATNPLLLTLLCLVFEEQNDFPPKRSELYKEGLEVLMKKWDAKRNIEREMIYKHLSPQNKEDMLGQIAFNTFVKGEYFFRQEDLQHQIKDYIYNLPEASADPEALRLDSEAVLKAIEHHHGLLVERARNIYSFSHLTFQEYFTAKEVERERQLEILVQNICDPRWNEVFYLTAEMLRRSDNLLLMMKARIDHMLAGDEKLQAFLMWAKQKADSVQTKYKPAAVRAFYAHISCRSAVSSSDIFDIELKIDVNLFDICFFQDLFLYLNSALNLALDLGLNCSPSHNFLFKLTSIRKAYYQIIIDSADKIREKLPELTRKSPRRQTLKLSYTLSTNINDTIQVSNTLFQESLQVLKDRLPIPNKSSKYVSQWWKNKGEEWSRELREVCIKYRNIGHDWQFTEEQGELLKKYYEANHLLVQCMNRSYVSKEVREAIEATLLLPISLSPN